MNCTLGGLSQGFPHSTAWTPITINRGAGVLPSVVAVADLNADGLSDVVVGYPGDTNATAQIIAFVQQSPTAWIPVVLASGQGVGGVSSLAIGDIDGDGLPDIIAGCNGQIVYLRQPNTPIAGGAWFADVIEGSQSSQVGRWTDVAIVQIDRALGPDIVACNESPGLLSWFRSPPNPLAGVNWQRFDIDTQHRAGAASIVIDDVDKDGNPDIICAARHEQTNTIAWFQHPGANLLNGQPWPTFPIGSLPDAFRIDIGDLDRDGRPDIVALDGTDRRVAWYAKPADPFTQQWTGVVLADFTANTPTDLHVVDVDRNGQPDVVVGTADAGGLRWFTPVNAVTARWVENNLADTDGNVARFVIADIDRDGKSDAVIPLIAQDSANDEIIWLRNPER